MRNSSVCSESVLLKLGFVQTVETPFKISTERSSSPSLT
ncbi:hypothetical protein CASFOL_014041 [Castilleja foliolosa]|uniref:Uncharacterized protein n=1 Tax=Castilleja foliolosa TaxID=1961234 RepID=A0ABD3DQR9_9LAMI